MVAEMGEAAPEAEVVPGAEGGHGEALMVLETLASSSLACTVPQFPTKWNSVKDKLRQLCSGLSLLRSNGGDGEDEEEEEGEEHHHVLAQFLQSASATVRAILDVASQCSDGTGGRLLSSSFAVLRNLSRVEEVKMFMVEQGVVTELVKLSQKMEEVRKLGAVELLHAMALDDADVREEAIGMGVIQSLLQLIYPDLPYSYKAREVALAAIWFFCFSSASSIDDLTSSDVLGWLLHYLNNGDYAVLDCTLKILRHLAEASEEYGRMMARAGYFAALSGLLAAKSFRVREMAAQVLSSLLALHGNRVIFIQDGDNLDRLLQLLDPSEGKLMAKGLILSAVMSLAETGAGRKKIVSSEHFGSLKELADSGDSDAKKVVKKIANSSRLQSMFSKIWSA
ncbi:unnamed protein product [Triticum turgidum subsp. durum]|uniref:DUF7032 domain-containing protein n=1 Tax=Triticum turgidum subsp. durum TaxID=4567 RepID=A0A9R1AA54_TRITD|nr:unnamed protein product [Triticum turgidum subsp. durum]